MADVQQGGIRLESSTSLTAENQEKYKLPITHPFCKTNMHFQFQLSSGAHNCQVWIFIIHHMTKKRRILRPLTMIIQN